MTEQNRDKGMEQAKPDHQSVLNDKKEFQNPEHKASGEATHKVQDMAQAAGQRGGSSQRKANER